MRDYIAIGSSPVDEDCAQVGSTEYDYYERAKRECTAFIHQLRRQFGEEPPSARLSVKSFSHDFGTYYEVVCYYDDEDEESMDYAFKLEAETPNEWDEKAKLELKKSKVEVI